MIADSICKEVDNVISLDKKIILLKAQDMETKVQEEQKQNKQKLTAESSNKEETETETKETATTAVVADNAITKQLDVLIALSYAQIIFIALFVGIYLARLFFKRM